MAARRKRLDAELVRRGLAATRSQAQRLVAQGRVTVGGAPALKPSAQVAPAEAVAVLEADAGYVSRGGHKLAGALEDLAVATAGRFCLDAGASTGGFTDVLLQREAARVVAVDVGYGQLDWRLRHDPRVVVLERTNVRTLTSEQLPPPPPCLVVADLSFISLTLVLPALRSVAAPDADFLLLVKPQFEVGPQAVGRGGVVREPALWGEALHRVVGAAAAVDLGHAGTVTSRLPGSSGNVEFFTLLRQGAEAALAPAVDAALVTGLQLRQPRG